MRCTDHRHRAQVPAKRPQWGCPPPTHAALCVPTTLLNTKRFESEWILAAPMPPALLPPVTAPRLNPWHGVDSPRARLRLGGAGTCCLNVNTSFIHLDWLSSAMLRYT